jgi:hypothetical protein
MKGAVLPLEGLNAKEQKRLMVLNRMMGVGEAGGVLGLLVRQVRRLLARYRKEGAAALAHGNRGRSPYNKLDDGVREEWLTWLAPNMAASIPSTFRRSGRSVRA